MSTSAKDLKGVNFGSSVGADMAADQVLSAALDQIIQHAGVTPGSNSERLLTYIVQETAAGRSDRLKAFTIGQDVFRRGTNFDASNDSIVRVEMKRLREILDHYYATAGFADPVRISVPKGSYVPVATYGTGLVQNGAANKTDPTSADVQWRRFQPVGLFLIALLLAFAVTFPLWKDTFRPGDHGVGQPRLRIVATGSASGTAYATAMDVLSRFHNIDLVTGVGSADGGQNADYELLLTPSADATLGQILVAGTREVVSSRLFYDPALSSGAVGAELTDFEVWLGQTASRNGLIEADFIRRNAYSGDFACSVLTEQYFSDQTDAHHLEARDCILSRLQSGHDSARLRIDLALLYREEQSDQRNLLPGNPLERAAQEAQAAIALDRFNANGYYALMTVHFAAGAVQAGIAMGERALNLNPYDGEALGGFAARINYVGQHRRALELFDASRKLTPGGVTWRDYGYFLAYLGLDDLPAAANAGIGLRGVDNELYLAAVAISATILGDPELAHQTKRALLKREPDLRLMYERRAYDATLINKIMRLLDSIKA